MEVVLVRTVEKLLTAAAAAAAPRAPPYPWPGEVLPPTAATDALRDAYPALLDLQARARREEAAAAKEAKSIADEELAVAQTLVDGLSRAAAAEGANGDADGGRGASAAVAPTLVNGQSRGGRGSAAAAAEGASGDAGGDGKAVGLGSGKRGRATGAAEDVSKGANGAGADADVDAGADGPEGPVGSAAWGGAHFSEAYLGQLVREVQLAIFHSQLPVSHVFVEYMAASTSKGGEADIKSMASEARARSQEELLHLGPAALR